MELQLWNTFVLTTLDPLQSSYLNLLSCTITDQTLNQGLVVLSNRSTDCEFSFMTGNNRKKCVIFQIPTLCSRGHIFSSLASESWCSGCDTSSNAREPSCRWKRAGTPSKYFTGISSCHCTRQFKETLRPEGNVYASIVYDTQSILDDWYLCVLQTFWNNVLSWVFLLAFFITLASCAVVFRARAIVFHSSTPKNGCVGG